jgi:multiple sugar transport system ATP-binding protein
MLSVPREVVAEHAGLSRFEGKPVVVGLRPEDIEDASLVPDAPEGRHIRTTVDLRESLGADVVVHFTVDAPPVVTEDTKELARDVGHDRLEAVERGAADRSEFVARLNPRTTATTGQPIELVVDVTRLHFFDPETGLAIYGDDGA